MPHKVRKGPIESSLEVCFLLEVFERHRRVASEVLFLSWCLMIVSRKVLLSLEVPGVFQRVCRAVC